MKEKRRKNYGSQVFLGVALVLVLSFDLTAPAWSAEKPAKPKTPNIEPKALEILKKMCDYLKGLQQFSCQAEITEDLLLTTGQKIQLGKRLEASVVKLNSSPPRTNARNFGIYGIDCVEIG